MEVALDLSVRGSATNTRQELQAWVVGFNQLFADWSIVHDVCSHLLEGADTIKRAID